VRGLRFFLLLVIVVLLTDNLEPALAATTRCGPVSLTVSYLAALTSLRPWITTFLPSFSISAGFCGTVTPGPSVPFFFFLTTFFLILLVGSSPPPAAALAEISDSSRLAIEAFL
jgi:hypothetical protein